MTFQELRTLVDYHYWARDRLLLRQLGVKPGKSMDMIAFYREQRSGPG